MPSCWARPLPRAGRCERGSRPAIASPWWAPNYPEWVILEFAAIMARLVLVMVNPVFRSQEAEYVLQQSRSARVITATEFRRNPKRLAPRKYVVHRSPRMRVAEGD
jgi:fatty-acyl-CoA synthase